MLILNDVRVSATAMWSGSIFHNVGAILQTDLLSPVTSFVRWSSMIILLCVLRDLLCFTSIRSDKYLGASPCKAFHTMTKHLNSILDEMGSQCSSINAGVMWSYLFVCVITLAASFCTYWSLEI